MVSPAGGEQRHLYLCLAGGPHPQGVAPQHRLPPVYRHHQHPEKEEVTIDFSPADYNWRVIYQQMPRKREEGEAHAQVVEWMRSGELNIKDFISDYFTFDQAVEAYQKLLDRKILKKGIITF